MLNLSVCIDMIMGDLPFDERIAGVAAVGIPAVEFWGWLSKDVGLIESATKEHGIRVATFLVDPRGHLVDADKKDEFIDGLRGSIPVADRLGTDTLLVVTGPELEGVPRERQHASIVDTLRAAAPIARDAGKTLVLEPLNILVDHKGYYLSSSDEGFAIIDEVDSPSVKLLYDIYHQQITEGRLIQTLTANIDRIGHFHVADVPGRHEPGTGEINYANVFRAIGDAGYTGFVGLEFSPTRDAATVLQEVRQLAS